jgi:hypothetical protein
LRAYKKHTCELENDEEGLSYTVPEGINSWVGQTTSNKVEGQIEVGEGKVCEDELDELVEELDGQEYFSCDRVVGTQDLTAVDESIHGGKEGTVQPASTLRDKLGQSV